MTNREESTQFSLTELLKLEDERIAEQRRREEDRVRAAEVAKETARRAEEAEAAASAARKARAELDELARREAMQKALVEQTRLEVDARTRAEERDLERRHELALAALKAEGSRSQLGTILGGTLLGTTLMLGAALAVHFAVLRPASDRRVAELTTSLATTEARASDLAAQVDADRKLIAQLRIATKPDVPAAAARSEPHPTPPRTSTPARTPAKAAAPDPCEGSHDPVCGLAR